MNDYNLCMSRLVSNRFVKVIENIEDPDVFFGPLWEPDVLVHHSMFEIRLSQLMKKLHKETKELLVKELYDDDQFRTELVSELNNYTESMDCFLGAVIQKRNKPIADIVIRVAMTHVTKDIINSVHFPLKA